MSKPKPTRADLIAFHYVRAFDATAQGNYHNVRGEYRKSHFFYRLANLHFDRMYNLQRAELTVI
jgi:hypothetical protein